jgi:hypothetical protein
MHESGESALVAAVVVLAARRLPVRRVFLLFCRHCLS